MAHKLHLEFCIQGIWRELPILVECDYDPYEPPSNDCPGDDESIEITSVMLDMNRGSESEMIDLLEDQQLEYLEDACVELEREWWGRERERADFIEAQRKMVFEKEMDE